MLELLVSDVLPNYRAIAQIGFESLDLLAALLLLDILQNFKPL